MTAVQSAAGGSGNAGGIRFEHRCLAWALAYLLTERPLPGWAGGAWVVGVGSQTFREVDDLGVLTDVGGWINAQVKKGLQCSTAPSGELADALAQCVALEAAGVPDRPPAQQARRLLDRQVDRVVILTDHEASTVITKGLANVTNRLRSWPVQLPLDEAAVNRDERRALEVLRQHVLRLLSAQRGEPAGEADLRSLARFLAVRGLDLRPEEGADQQALSVVLREIVERPEQAGALWARLESIGQDLAVSRSWLQRDQLVHLLESGPGEFRLTVASRLRRDVALLREITAANLAAPPTALSIGTPDGPVAVPRTIAALLPPAQGEVLAVTGEPGCGKSVLLHSLAVAGEADVIYLTHQQLRNSAGQTRIELNLEHELAEILLGWTGSRPGRLLLDGLDQTRGSDAASWLPQLAGRLRGSRWSVIGSIRLFDLRHGLSWRSMFAGNPLDTGHAHPDLGQVSHVLVDDLNDTELAALHTTSPALRTVAERAGHRLQMLLANPFNLSLVGELLTAGLDVSRISSRLDLLARFRELRVAGAPDGRTRHRALATLVTAMVARRCQEISDDVITDTSLLAVVNDLLSDGVLRDLPVGRWTADRVVGFAHPVLFDYEVALHALGDLRSPGSLAGILDTDPDRVITVRPSLDYRLAMIWHEHANRAAFWELAHRLMAHRGGHVLAAAAAAAVAARELHEPADLRPLEAALVAQEPSMASRDDLWALTFLLAAGLSTSRNAEGLDAFGHLLGALADAATHSDDSGLALLLAQLGPRATGDRLPAARTPAGRGLVRAAIATMTVALADPDEPQRARVAQAAARALRDAVILDAGATAEVVRGAIATPVLQAWGVHGPRELIGVLPQITVQDPDLAYDVAASVSRLPADVGTRYPFGSQIISLNVSSRDELDSVRHQTSRIFAKVVSTDLRTATRMLVGIAEHEAEYFEAIPPGPGLRICSGGPLDRGGENVISSMTQAMAAGLERDDGGPVRAAVTILIDDLVRAEVWELLLQAAANGDTAAAAQALTPALMTSSLFAEPLTWQPAQAVVERIAPHLGGTDRERIRAAIIAGTRFDTEMSEAHRDTLLRRRHLLLATLDNRNPHLPPPRLHGKPQGWIAEPTIDEPDELIRTVDAALADAEPSDADSNVLARRWPALLQRCADQPEARFQYRLARTAGRLAATPAAGPNTVIGQQILGAIQQLLTPKSSLAAESPAEANVAGVAITATVSLLRQPDWRHLHGERLRALLQALLGTGGATERLQIAGALPWIYPDPDELLTRVEELLSGEHNGPVLIAALHALARFGRAGTQQAQQADQILLRVTRSRPQVFLLEPGRDKARLRDSPAAALVPVLAILAVESVTPFADRTVRAWLHEPAARSTEITLTAEALRASLNPAGAADPSRQHRAFALYALAAAQAGCACQHPDSALGAVVVADALATNLYHASGAFTEGRPMPIGDPRTFASLALPVLTDLAEVGHPAVTHHIVQTAEHLSEVVCKDALLLTQHAVTKDAGYIIEQLGVDAALNMINRCVADHRDLVLSDPDCITAVRTVLEQFVRAGWPRAIDTAENLDQLFR